jgi:hypothetical protein
MPYIDLDFPRNERIEPRVPASGMGYLTFFRQGVLITVTAAVVEVSTSSMQLVVNEPIEPGGKIELGLRRLIVQGEIKDCRINEVGLYRLSIRTHRVFDAAEFRHI